MRIAFGISVCIALVLGSALAHTSPQTSLQTPPLTAEERQPSFPKRATLWHIVHGLCVPGQRSHGDPKPCTSVTLPSGSEAQGYVVLKDRKGVAQYLVMPTLLISGIEDKRLLSPATPNYFASAWRSKALVEERLGHRLAREDVGVAVNSSYGRSQDLLHFHVDCLRADVREALRQALPSIGYRWSARPFALGRQRYYALRIDGEDNVTSPFVLLAKGLHVKPKDMGAWTLVLAGARFADGKAGFVLLADKANLLAGDFASGEDLQDHDCRLRDQP